LNVIKRWGVSIAFILIISIILNKRSDENNNVYVGVTVGDSPGDNFVISFDDGGELRWKLEVLNERLGASAAITNNSKLVFPTFRYGNMLIIN